MNTALVDGYLIDVDALKELFHMCHPPLCKHQLSCCEYFSIEATEEEVLNMCCLLQKGCLDYFFQKSLKVVLNYMTNLNILETVYTL